MTSEKIQGITVSVILHIALAVFLILSSFKVKPTMPVEVEEGLLVNFGYDETGSGLFEPAPQPAMAVAPVSAGEEAADDALLTQDFEEAAEVKKSEPDPEKAKRDAERLAAEKKRREEAEAERKRIEQENAEKRRIEEQQRIQARANERAMNAFGSTGDQGESGTSEGIAGGQGNQGVETGTVGARNYGPGGGPGNGTISFKLGSRNYRTLPVPRYDYQGEGIVVVEITVDRNGVVTKAEPGVKGSTTLEQYLLNAAKEAALKAKFDSDQNAPLLQKGTITYNFKLK